MPASSNNSDRPGNPSPRKDAPAGREDAFDAPPIARKDAPEGPDVTTRPGAEVGHYGPGYGDPTVHQGGDWPGKGANLPPAGSAAQATPMSPKAADPAASKGDDGQDRQGGEQQ